MKLRARNILPTACITYLVLLVIATVFAGHITDFDPRAMAPLHRLQAPSAEHFFGTDSFGRDVFTRTLFGGQVSLVVGVAVTVLALLVGTVIGLLSGYFSVLDKILMRLMDGIMSMPAIVLAVALMALFTADVKTVVIAITIPEIPRVARLVRSVVLTIREQEFVQAAIVTGCTVPQILYRHILPNAAGPLAVQATFVCASAILLEAYLSFLGVGLPQETPTWGNIMSGGRLSVQIAFWAIFYPGVVLALTILSVNVLGDSIRDLFDPKGKK
ncbi:ABC transporter permease [Burkholderia anthina]|uniref:ABC transporter permease n=1 Tax=Burkholderia anthina TaxID=179879 RepID=UPI0015898947|nr:ABC transporter permease [Burkholderia anthina]